MNKAITLSPEIALNHDGGVPEWIELLPAGPRIQGVDGRTWLHDQPDEVVANSRLPFPLDWEHATEIRAPKGEEAPAAGWIEALKVRDGAIWGKTAWNAGGRDAVSSRAYRFISPVILFEKQSTRVVALTSAALTNRPNFSLKALNHFHHHQQEQDTMDPEILKALNLSTDAGATAVVTAINTLKGERDGAVSERDQAKATLTQTQADLATARNRADTPDLAKFVPRADYDAAIERATNAEQTLQAQQDAAHEAEIETAVNAAIEAGQIAPANKDYYVASCQQEGGLARFKAFAESAPKIIADSGPDGKTPPDAANTTLTDEEKAMCRVQGIDEAEFLKTKQELSTATA